VTRIRCRTQAQHASRLRFTASFSLTFNEKPLLIDTLCSSLSVVVSFLLLTTCFERWADMFCVSILGMSIHIRPRATTYFLLDSSFSFLPPSRRLRCCLKPTIFDDGPPLNITAMNTYNKDFGQLQICLPILSQYLPVSATSTL
jgi:hypothetical protein